MKVGWGAGKFIEDLVVESDTVRLVFSGENIGSGMGESTKSERLERGD